MRYKICNRKKIVCFLVLALAVFQTLLAQTDFSVEKSVRYLASEELEGRAAGTVGDSLAADYIAQTFASFGLKPLFEDYFQHFRLTSRDTVATRNVIAVREGTDSILKNRYIVICAHFDHLGQKKNGLYLGANDNASGTAALLNLARLFAQTPTSKTLIFAAFGAEEKGLVGASYFVNNLPFPVKNIDAVFNFDMVGRLAYDKFSVKGMETSKMLEEFIKTEARNSGLTIKPSDNKFFSGSDHYAFYLKKIPFLCFNTGSDAANYHKPSDVAENIDFKGIETISEIAFRVIKNLANTNLKPDFKVVKEAEYKIPKIDWYKFGFFINMLDLDAEELKIMYVHKNGQLAGLQKGDILLKINGKEIASLEDFVEALINKSPKTNQITVKRKQEIITVKVKK